MHLLLQATVVMALSSPYKLAICLRMLCPRGERLANAQRTCQSCCAAAAQWQRRRSDAALWQRGRAAAARKYRQIQANMNRHISAYVPYGSAYVPVCSCICLFTYKQIQAYIKSLSVHIRMYVHVSDMQIQDIQVHMSH